ncbi:MAG: HAD-IG family 5'-nucleotidase [Myxococcota bacterium]|nr:HAD-IG family 5'-nucleotidase [Myxococcota bacterium]
MTTGRGLYCNRTLNLRSIRAIGYDMDYTLIHYFVNRWEACAFSFLKQNLAERGVAPAKLAFDPDFAVRGLIVDTELGNLVKADRFGYIKRAAHGTRVLDFDEQRRTYSRTIVDLGERRWAFLNTLFSLSEACCYAQLVDALDAAQIRPGASYLDLYRLVREALDEAHMEGELKAAILAEPARFVDDDPLTARTLLDQREAGKKLLLVTNSEWFFTNTMMRFAIERHLPSPMRWTELFDLVVVGARKPEFFLDKQPAFEIVDDSGLMRPVNQLEFNRRYHGANARQVESLLGLDGAEILYVGDHIYSDVHVSKAMRRWRTALVIREIEDEVAAEAEFAPYARQLAQIMEQKDHAERALNAERLALLRLKSGASSEKRSVEAIKAELEEKRAELSRLDALAEPLARSSSHRHHAIWGPLMRSGHDKSHLARQIERHADIYTSRVSNLAEASPFAYLRSHGGTLPHDEELPHLDLELAP